MNWTDFFLTLGVGLIVGFACAWLLASWCAQRQINQAARERWEGGWITGYRAGVMHAVSKGLLTTKQAVEAFREALKRRAKAG